MTTKLTLTLEKEIIERAKRYAQSTGRSLSDLIENYLDTISNPKKPNQDKMPKKIQRMYGAVKLPPHLNHKAEIRRILTEVKGK